jgi:hypothetical protein
MVDNIRKCVEALKKLEKNFSYGEIETAFYIYARLGEKAAEELSNEDIEELYNTMQDIDGSIFNEDLNDWTYNNLEV